MSNIDMNADIRVLVTNPTILEYNDQAVVIMDAEKPVWLKTSSTGRWLFEQLRNRDMKVQELISLTTEEFSLPEKAVKDSILNLLENLQEDGFISLNGSQPLLVSVHKTDTDAEKSVLLPDDLPKHGLVSVWFNLLSQCNLKCSHCFLPDPEHSKPISFENAQKIIDILAKNDVKRLYFSGGEPLIHPYLLEIVKYANKVSKWQIFIITNGYTDNYSLIEELANYVDYFQISIDGIDAKTHNKIRGDNSFEKATKLFSIINNANKKAKTGLSFTPLPENVEQIPKLLTLGIELQTDAIYVTKPKKPTRNVSSNNGQFSEFLSEEFRKKIMDKYDLMVQRYLRFTKDTATVKGVKIPVLDPSFDSALNLLLCTKRGCCSAAGNTLFVDENGECFPCAALSLPEHSLGNMLKEPFETIYIERGVKGFRQNIHFSHIEDCKECEFKYFCAGDCRALGSNVREKTPYCNLIKERYGKFLQGVRPPK